jgi:hypothetical protein
MFHFRAEGCHCSHSATTRLGQHTLLINRRKAASLSEKSLRCRSGKHRKQQPLTEAAATKLHFLSPHQASLSHIACSIRHVMSICHLPNDQTRELAQAGCHETQFQFVMTSAHGVLGTAGRPSRMNRPVWRATKLRGVHRTCADLPANEWHPFPSLSPIRAAVYVTLTIYICKTASCHCLARALIDTLARLQKGIPCSSFAKCYWITGKFSYVFPTTAG